MCMYICTKRRVVNSVTSSLKGEDSSYKILAHKSLQNIVNIDSPINLDFPTMTDFHLITFPYVCLYQDTLKMKVNVIDSIVFKNHVLLKKCKGVPYPEIIVLDDDVFHK